MIIIDHEFPAYKMQRSKIGKGRYNGAYYYSKEIVDIMIDRVDTDRNWVTININGACVDHSIVFIHNNLNPERYEWLSQYDDLVLICGIEETCEKVEHLGKPLYLPLSIDVDYVKRFKVEEHSGEAFVGRLQKARSDGINLPKGVRCISGLPREELLSKVAKLESAYAVGRCAIEAKALGVSVKHYDDRYPDTSVWKVIDTREASEMLCKLLKGIGG